MGRRFDSGTQSTTRHIRQVLPHVLDEITHVYKDRPDLILAAWPDVVGEKIAPMTQAVAFNEGILRVIVKNSNSTLYSLLSQHDKPRLIKNLRDKFPSVEIKTIVFRLG